MAEIEPLEYGDAPVNNIVEDNPAWVNDNDVARYIMHMMNFTGGHGDNETLTEDQLNVLVQQLINRFSTVESIDLFTNQGPPPLRTFSMGTFHQLMQSLRMNTHYDQNHRNLLRDRYRQLFEVEGRVPPPGHFGGRRTKRRSRRRRSRRRNKKSRR